MNIFGYEVCSWLVLKLVATISVLSIGAALVLLRIYCCVTCGYYKDKSKKMNGKTVIVTGGNGGIGKETCKELAERGAKLIIACRNLDSGNQTKEEITKATGNTDITVKKLDLSSLKSVREFATDIKRNYSNLHVLIHNAGTAETKRKVTEDGLELTMATNHFGPFLLTHLLIDLLKATPKSRIVIVASELYRIASLNLNKLNPVDTWFPVYLYYVSKYANICFSNELARRLEGSGITVNCLHPGMVDTGIWRNTPFPLNYPMGWLCRAFFKTPQQGCQTTVYLAASDEVEGVSGKYFMDCKERGLSSGAADMNKAKKLWELSEKFVKLQDSDPKI